MTALPLLIDQNGYPVRPDQELGEGAEGKVYSLPNDANRVAKIYLPNKLPLTIEAIEKLKVQIAFANSKLFGVAAWPNGLLSDARTRQPVGFTMPRLDGYKDIWLLFHPAERLKHFPRAGWRFQTRAANNLAAAFDEVHSQGIVVGDVQLKNAVVSQQALVKLVDCDSVQVWASGRHYCCNVGLPHYIPPELQGKPLRGLVRTTNHDRFGLAVLIFQLLFVGRHPYQGIYRGTGDPTFEQFIAGYMFAHGPRAASAGMDSPPYTPTLDNVPPDVAALFRRAFERGSETGTRPHAAEWLAVLSRLEKCTVSCPADPGHQHWAGSRGCPWCRLAANGGPEYYFGVAGGGGDFAVDEAKLQEVLRRLSAARLVAFHYDRAAFSPKTRPVSTPLPGGLNEYTTILYSLGTILGVCGVLVLLGWLVHVNSLAIVGGLGTMIFGTWVVSHAMHSPWHRERELRRESHRSAKQKLQELERKWEITVSWYERAHAEHVHRANRLMADCRGLAAEYNAATHKLSVNAEAAARERHLRLYLIADGDISQIGAVRKSTLVAHGVVTAADIDRKRVKGIWGFGDTYTDKLMAWRKEVLKSFKFDPKIAVSPADREAIATTLRLRQRNLFVELDRTLTGLERLSPKCHTEIDTLMPKLIQAVAELEQAEADLRSINCNQ